MSDKYFVRVEAWARELAGLPEMECPARVAQIWRQAVKDLGSEEVPDSLEIRTFRTPLGLTGLAPNTRFLPPIDYWVALGRVKPRA